MDPDDPFSHDPDDDKTVLRPRPGRRPAAPAPEKIPPPEQVSPSDDLFDAPPVGSEPSAPVTLESVHGFSGNPLIKAATPLLSLVGQLRGQTVSPNIKGLRNYIVQQLKELDPKVRAEGASSGSVVPARYALCTLLDEIVLGTPWGSESAWSKQSLLVTFHNEAWGGEKFFQVLDRLNKEPARNLDLLELLFICLSFGFQGKYRVAEGGQAQLERIRDNLFQTIRAQRKTFEQALSPHWRGVQDKRNALIRYVPLWVIGAIAALILFASFIGFRFSLNDIAHPVFTELNDVGRQTQVVEAVSAPVRRPAPQVPRLSGLLQKEVDQGLVDVITDANKSTIRIRGDGLFRSGSAVVEISYHPLLARITYALQTVPGQVLVVGHTDNVPIRSLRFQSNWDLSRRRATDVMRILAQEMGSSARLTAEGRADTEPLVANDTRANRARNRRVEITLLPPD